MNYADVTLWIADLIFLACVTLGWGRWFRWTTEKDNDVLTALFFGGIGLVAIYAIVLSPTYYLIVGA